MQIVVIGNDLNLKECQEKFGTDHQYEKTDHKEVKSLLKPGIIVFDFEPNDLLIYDQNNITVFLNSTFTTLLSLTGKTKSRIRFFGFCGINSFLNREILEVTTVDGNSHVELERICSQLNTKFKIVDDQVGMITPRIISMIINEAFYAIEESVASRVDIDLAMKLGTNYPFGPFEWCNKIGIQNVHQLLKAVYENTNDDRYKICQRLTEEALA